MSEAARLTIERGLRRVVEFLPLAAKHPDDDVEYVHQLRVATRRSTAALDLFSEQLPGKRRRGLRKQLRQIRRAAGAARDLDVMLIRFRGRAEESRDKRVRKVIANLETRRKQAQRGLVDVRRKMKREKFHKCVRGLVQRVRWRSPEAQPTFHLNACQVLEQAAAQFFLTAHLDSQDVDVLHRTRLEAKRLRYTTEIVAPAFDRSFRKQFYPELVALQDALGRINDHAAASLLFAGWADQSASGRLLLQASREEQAAITGAIHRLHDEWPRVRVRRLRQALKDHVAGGVHD